MPAVAGILLLTACAHAMMAVRPELAQVAVTYPIDGQRVRSGSGEMQIGPWRVGEVEAGWGFGWGLAHERWALVSTSTPFSFALLSPAADPVRVECRWREAQLNRGSWSMDLSDLLDPRLRCAPEAVRAATAPSPLRAPIVELA